MRLLAFGLAMAVVTGCARTDPPTREPLFTKSHLAVLPGASELRPNSLIVSDDGEAYAFLVGEADGRGHVVSSSGVGASHREIGRPTFAPRTHRLFYWYADEIDAGKRYALHADGVDVPMPYARPGMMEFGDVGGHWSTSGLEPGPAEDQPGPFRLFADGSEAGRYRDASFPAISRDGHVAFLVDDDGTLVLMVDGAQRQTFSTPTAPCAVKSLRAAGSPQLPKHHIVRYLADGSLLIVARDADGWGVYHDETRWASYPVSNADPPDDECKNTAVLAPGSIRRAEKAPVVAWFERLPGEEERWRVLRNGQPIDDFLCTAPWNRQPPELDAEGRHVAYACAAKNAQGTDEVFVVRDGVRYGPYPEVWGMALSENGAHVTYGAADGEPPRPWAIYVDGEKRTGRYEATWRPRVSDDGATVVWEAQNEPGKRGWLGIDDRAIGSFDGIHWGPEFAPGDRVAWIIRRGRKLTHISVSLAAGSRRASNSR